MLSIDLKLLENGERFQKLCFRLAQYEFPDVVPAAVGSWDGGRDIIQFGHSKKGDVIWQCKFTSGGLNASLKNKIRQSIDSLDKSERLRKWILCLSVDATGKFHDWLHQLIADYPFIERYEVWDRQWLLQHLENHPDILQTFFYRYYVELEQHFRTEELELIKFDVDSFGGWIAKDPKILYFLKKASTDSDLVLDVIVRNRGTIEALLKEIIVELKDVRRHLRGVPGEALLFPQIAYVVSLGNGKPGRQLVKLEPPLTVKAGSHERFKIRCTEVGFAWSGALQLALRYGPEKVLSLPWMRIFA